VLSRYAKRAAFSLGLAAACAALALTAAMRPLHAQDAEEAPAAQEDALKKYEAQVDQAVERGLQYLAERQTESGAFQSTWTDNTGVVSLCVMAFLARGHTPGDGPYGEVINKGVDYVLDHSAKNGMLIGRNSQSGGMYSHSISSLMLSEVSGMVNEERQRRIDEALPKALKIILSAQQVHKNAAHQGGWRYSSASRDSDISCTGWPLMALRSARNSGAHVPREAIEDAVGFILRCRNQDGGFGYVPGGSSGVARTGVGLLSLELCGHHDSAEARSAAEWILKRPKPSWYYYGLYYCSQGMYQIGGDYWERYAPLLYEDLLPRQAKDGSWPDNISSGSQRAGKAYSTAMAVLALSVPYCQLPIYQR